MMMIKESWILLDCAANVNIIRSGSSRNKDMEMDEEAGTLASSFMGKKERGKLQFQGNDDQVFGLRMEAIVNQEAKYNILSMTQMKANGRDHQTKHNPRWTVRQRGRNGERI